MKYEDNPEKEKKKTCENNFCNKGKWTKVPNMAQNTVDQKLLIIRI